MNQVFKNYLLRTTESSDCKEVEVIQSLWSGYGKISRYELKNSSLDTVVVKHISLNPQSEHPRGWDTSLSHKRKVKSYEVETIWYKEWSHKCNTGSKVPKFIGSFSKGKDQWIILEDLNTSFPLRKQELNLSEIKACLKWLANFHAQFLNHEPKGLWTIGTYWHLETRPEEFERMENRELKSKAHLIDKLLNDCKFQTIVHGDAKLANFCFSKDENVAAVDFQYVGGGCGMKDVAYFIGSCLSSDECDLYQNKLLDDYFSELQVAMKSTETSLHFKSLEAEWKEMYPLACADFTRFLMGWMPSHHKINKYNISLLQSVLSSL